MKRGGLLVGEVYMFTYSPGKKDDRELRKENSVRKNWSEGEGKESNDIQGNPAS